MLKDLIEEAAEMDLEPKPASLWWTSTYASEEKEDMILGTSKVCSKFPSERMCFESSRENVRCCGRTNAVSKQGLLEGHCDIQEQRCSVEGKMSTSGGHHVYAVFSFGSENWSSWTQQTLEKPKDVKR